MSYRAPVDQIRFTLKHVVDADAVLATARFADAADSLDPILTEAGRMADQVLAPLNRAGDTQPARLESGSVRSTPGYADGFRAIADGGWIGLASDPEYGGMGLPQVMNMAVHDMIAGACLSLQLNPLLTQGQIEALQHHASDDLKALYLPQLNSGVWSGTMNLTEPGAGSDVGALVTKAVPAGDGTYGITGQKIFITWGDCDFVENVSHLVLARLPDAVPGVKGISLFLVPKYLPDADGKPGAENGVKVVSLEEKLGIHGSPTCVMQFDNATGWLVGQPHKGMAAMFTMMNNARLGVGVQGVAQAEAALQQAIIYATERKQFGPIIDHPDVRRMLATARAEIFAARAICLACAAAGDMAAAGASDPEGVDWAARAALLTPVAKAHGTDVGCRVADIAVQVYGGMGYIEETGAAQYLRDVRITPIYEGTNGIQAMDLVGRKMMDKGAALNLLLDEIADHGRIAHATLPDLANAVWDAVETLREASQDLLKQDMPERYAGAVPYLHALARVLGGHYHLKAAMSGDPARVTLARVYIRRVLPRYAADLAELSAGLDDLNALTSEVLAG